MKTYNHQIYSLQDEIINLRYNVALASLNNDKLDFALNANENQTFDMYIAERDLQNCLITIKKSLKNT